jgi:hypothetical protein
MVSRVENSKTPISEMKWQRIMNFICHFIAPNIPYQIKLKYEVMKLLPMMKIYKNPNLFKSKW